MYHSIGTHLATIARPVQHGTAYVAAGKAKRTLFTGLVIAILGKMTSTHNHSRSAKSAIGDTVSSA